MYTNIYNVSSALQGAAKGLLMSEIDTACEAETEEREEGGVEVMEGLAVGNKILGKASSPNNGDNGNNGNNGDKSETQSKSNSKNKEKDDETSRSRSSMWPGSGPGSGQKKQQQQQQVDEHVTRKHLLLAELSQSCVLLGAAEDKQNSLQEQVSLV